MKSFTILMTVRSSPAGVRPDTRGGGRWFFSQ
jgi:hypothetical protein